MTHEQTAPRSSRDIVEGDDASLVFWQLSFPLRDPQVQTKPSSDIFVCSETAPLRRQQSQFVGLL